MKLESGSRHLGMFCQARAMTTYPWGTGGPYTCRPEAELLVTPALLDRSLTYCRTLFGSTLLHVRPIYIVSIENVLVTKNSASNKSSSCARFALSKKSDTNCTLNLNKVGAQTYFLTFYFFANKTTFSTHKMGVT